MDSSTKMVKLAVLMTGIFSMLTFAMAATNGYNVRYAEHKTGAWRASGTVWTEIGRTNQGKLVTFQFVEISRDAWSVYMLDATRDYRIQIDIYRSKILLSTATGSPYVDYLDILKSDSFVPTTGWTVKYAAHSKGGNFAANGKIWTETGTNVTFRFDETSRDAWSVYMIDTSRDYRIQIDIYRKKIRLSTATGSPYFDYLDITSSGPNVPS